MILNSQNGHEQATSPGDVVFNLHATVVGGKYVALHSSFKNPL